MMKNNCTFSIHFNLFQPHKIFLRKLYIAIILAFFITACVEGKKEEETIATVNDAPISLKEFQRDVSIYSKRYPPFKATSQTLKEHLDTIIDKKLMIQEAMKMELSEKEQFVETIKTFWEQTLIRELIDVKSKEWANRLFITEDEIQKQYQRMQYAPTVNIVRTVDRKNAEDARQKMLKGEQIPGEETIGPLFSENLSTGILNNAFDMDVGEVRVFENEKCCMLMHVINKGKTSMPPLKEVYSQIKLSLLEQKKQKAMEEWLKDVRKSAKVEVNNRLLERIVHD